MWAGLAPRSFSRCPAGTEAQGQGKQPLVSGGTWEKGQREVARVSLFQPRPGTGLFPQDPCPSHL